MASDVEVLRALWHRSNRLAPHVELTELAVEKALSSAISALEAREAEENMDVRANREREMEKHWGSGTGLEEARDAQPKVEGQMGDAEWDSRVLDLEGNGGHPSALLSEGARARASERAWEAKWLQERMEHKKTREVLSKRVEELEKYMAWARTRLGHHVSRSGLAGDMATLEHIERLIGKDSGHDAP